MKDLVEIIKANPGCVATIDNDYWNLHKERPAGMDWDDWHDDCLLASSDDELKGLGDGGYGSGNCYGGDILQALAVIVGVKVESV